MRSNATTVFATPATPADNVLMFPAIESDFGYWLAGFIDGEGTFNILVSNCSLYCAFKIGLRLDDLSILEMIRGTLGMGQIHIGKASRTPTRNNNPQAQFYIAAVADCLKLVYSQRRFPLRTKKRADFEVWAQAVEYLYTHRTYGNQFGKSLVKRSRDQRMWQFKEILQKNRCYNGSK